LRRGHVKQYKMDRGCFALEYARGEFGFSIIHKAVIVV